VAKMPSRNKALHAFVTTPPNSSLKSDVSKCKYLGENIRNTAKLYFTKKIYSNNIEFMKARPNILFSVQTELKSVQAS
jgi:hypothetical protein